MKSALKTQKIEKIAVIINEKNRNQCYYNFSETFR